MFYFTNRITTLKLVNVPRACLRTRSYVKSLSLAKINVIHKIGTYTAGTTCFNSICRFFFKTFKLDYLLNYIRMSCQECAACCMIVCVWQGDRARLVLVDGTLTVAIFELQCLMWQSQISDGNPILEHDSATFCYVCTSLYIGNVLPYCIWRELTTLGLSTAQESQRGRNLKPGKCFNKKVISCLVGLPCGVIPALNRSWRQFIGAISTPVRAQWWGSLAENMKRADTIRTQVYYTLSFHVLLNASNNTRRYTQIENDNTGTC
jgi:hypothetical protein